MKKFMICFAAAVISALAFVTVGCKSSIPTSDTIYAVAESVGKTAGFAIELSKTKQEVKDSIIYVLDVISATVPGTNETFVAKWTPLAEAEVQKLIDAGTITAEEGKIVGRAVYVACEGIDFIFVRYPVAKQYKDLVAAAVDGFITGFKSIVKTAFAVTPDFDMEAYTYLKMKAATYQNK